VAPASASVHSTCFGHYLRNPVCPVLGCSFSSITNVCCDASHVLVVTGSFANRERQRKQESNIVTYSDMQFLRRATFEGQVGFQRSFGRYSFSKHCFLRELFCGRGCPFQKPGRLADQFPEATSEGEVFLGTGFCESCFVGGGVHSRSHVP